MTRRLIIILLIALCVLGSCLYYLYRGDEPFLTAEGAYARDSQAPPKTKFPEPFKHLAAFMGIEIPKPDPVFLKPMVNQDVLLCLTEGVEYLGVVEGERVQLIQRSKHAPMDFMKKACWRIVLGLSGDQGCVSLFHKESGAYLNRMPNGRLGLMSALPTDNETIYRESATFKCREAGQPGQVQFMALPIGQETVAKYLVVRGALPSVEVVEQGTPIKLVEPIHERPAELFQDSGLMPRCDKTSGKRQIHGCVEEGELTENEIRAEELFEDIPSPYSAGFDPKKADVFQEHNGAEFSQILNSLNKSASADLTDKLFYKLENAKIDPDIENLMEYNEARHKIYDAENTDFEKKIKDRIRANTDAVDAMAIDMNNYRVQQMARDYYFLADKLVKSRGSNAK